jgi:hypothetical protein
MYIFDGEAYTGHSSCTHFRYSRFCILAVLFQCHEKHQCLMCRHGINCCICPASCVHSCPNLPHHFDLAMSFPTPFTPFLMAIQCISCCFFILVGYLTVGSMYVCMYVYSRGGPQTAPAPRPSLIYCAFPYT